MSKRRRHRKSGTIEEFIEIQEHRYDPGYWVTKVKGGGLTPLGKRVGEVHFSTFSRALIMFVLVASVPIGLFLRLGDRLPYAGYFLAVTLALLFFALWYLTGRAIKNSKHREP
jgi:hypothetical protein